MTKILCIELKHTEVVKQEVHHGILRIILVGDSVNRAYEQEKQGFVSSPKLKPTGEESKKDVQDLDNPETSIPLTENLVEEQKISDQDLAEEIDDPYNNAVSSETIREYHDELKTGFIYDLDQSFEFEPEFIPKNLEDYTAKPDQSLIELKEFPVYTKELNFVIKGR